MKKMISAGLILGVAAVTGFADVNKAPSFQKIEKEIMTTESYGLKPVNNAEKNQIQRIIGLPKNMIRFYGKKRGPKEGLVEYVLTMKGRPLVLYKNTKQGYYIAGYIFDKNGKNLTVNEVKNTFDKIAKEQYKNFFTQIKKKAPDFVIELKGQGPKDKMVVIYTDPQCPFCERFEKQFKGLEYLQKHYGKIYVVEFPLYFHKEAEQRVYWIISNVKKAKDSGEKIRIIKEGSTKSYDEIVKENKQNKADYSKQLKAMRSIQSPMNFGTPSITDEKGNNIRERVIKEIMKNNFHLKDSQISIK